MGKQCKCVIKDRLQIFEPFIYKTAHKNISLSCTQWRPHSHSINLFIEFGVKHKKTILRCSS